jgi:hypothetical protein
VKRQAYGTDALQKSGIIDFIRLSLILTGERKCGGAAWLRGPRKIGRPLEPDAGNAAEGSEAWPCVRSRMAFCLTTNGHESTRMIFEPDICVPLFVIPSEVEGSLDISARP